MANMLENFGLDFFSEDDNSLMGFVGYITREGKALTGYYGNPYLFKPMGDVEFWVKTEKNPAGNLHVTGFDSHCGNLCVWDLIHSGIDITPKDASKLERVVMFNRADTHGGLLPIEVITADILPSLMKDDKVTMQVVALPLEINYYANEEEYAEAQPSDENGKRWLMATGSMAAISFLYNHAPGRYEQGKDYETDRYVQFTAIVKKLYHGTFEMNGEKHNTFVRCFVDTEYGELEFDHTLEQVPKELRDNIRVGAVVSGTCILSGDVAIKKYDKGIIRDFEHNLKLLRYTMSKGDPERLASVLADDVVYETDTSGKKYVGAGEIINRFIYIHNNRDSEYTTYYATITATDEDDMEYSVGTRCIILAKGEDEDNYESIAFINVDDNGMIFKIKISTDSRYHYRIDRPKKVRTPLDDIKVPDSVLEPIILRAKFNGIIDHEVEESSVTENIADYYSLEQNAQRMLDALQEDPQPDAEKAFANIFGYLFAKAIEQTVNEDKNPGEYDTRLTASFKPDEVFAGEISSTLSAEEHAALEKAMKLGTQFYNDFKAYIQMTDTDEDQFVGLFKQAAVVVQRLGQMYSDRYDEK